ncbi:hypothetical protein ABEW05_002838 [Botrytis cinerea]
MPLTSNCSWTISVHRWCWFNWLHKCHHLIGATNLGPLDDLEPFSFHVVPPNPMLEAWLAEAMENLDNDNWPALTEYARLVGGHESVYDLPVETTEVDESRREASLEITPISESKW